MCAPELADDGSTDAMFGSYAPAPGVSTLRTLARCDDDERNAALGMWDSSDICFFPRYEPGPGVSSPMMSSFISRAEDAPNAPEPARFERPKDDAAKCARSRFAFGSYAPGSPVASSTCNREAPDLNADACPSFARHLREARDAGVRVIAERVRWTADGRALSEGALEVYLPEDDVPSP